MLIEMFSEVFKTHGKTREKIVFHKGLNVISGDKNAANSIGKSSALLAIDFVFGGNTYLNSEGVKYLGHHSIYFCFEFDKKYYFVRKTDTENEIYPCNNKYEVIGESISKQEFIGWLKEKYFTLDTPRSFRELVGTYFRIYGKYNYNEKKLLKAYPEQSTRDSVRNLVSLFNFYKEIKAFSEKLESEEKRLTTFKNSRSYGYSPNKIKSKTEFEDNEARIEALKYELENLPIRQNSWFAEDTIEKTHKKYELSSHLLQLEEILSDLKRRQTLVNISLEYGLYPSEADLEELTKFFPNVNIKKIYEIEKYHKKLARILDEEFKSESEVLEHQIKDIKTKMNKVQLEIKDLGIIQALPKEFLEKHDELKQEIREKEEQNNAYIEEERIRNAKKQAKENLERSIKEVLDEIELTINNKLKEFNSLIHGKNRHAPHLNLASYNSYEFYTPKDDGTGTNYKGMILFDLSVLSSTELPAIIHDSLLFKNIDDETINGIMQIYAQKEMQTKQIFIAFDKDGAYLEDTKKIIKQNEVLRLSENGNELYGVAWNKEVE
ncbi:DUF2326 domain-containing protein [Ligilactobacillus ceti]|uniref:ATPase n=1 Tax=Ligilactobacillus ceti DSM 22408 TaxID=1122146 RepID=A0A0R2KH55_9LACO|nr:DUF2326 domain-containing protein [Ligilactobacillus ceti]KRN88687.1 ATPase [Ligilactobacillus ceti DSM 22408]